MSLKGKISSPLEAGTSILDAHQLPPHLLEALDYASARLASKELHITLIVVRRDYQLPSTIPPVSSQSLSSPTTPSSPRFGLPASPVPALRQLMWSAHTSSHGPPSPKMIRQEERVVSPLAPKSVRDAARSRGPGTPKTPLSPPPMTPLHPVPSKNTRATGPVTWNACGIRLIYPAGLPAQDQRMLHHALQRAEKKFNLGSECLTPAVGPAACGLTNRLILQSILQNKVVFSSEGMTLFALDRLYSLKAALSAYYKTWSPLRLEDAANELRRLFLANKGSKVPRADLLRSYDWLSISHSAVTDLDRMYKRMYGGQEGIGAISGINDTRMRSVAKPTTGSEDKPKDKDPKEHEIKIGLANQAREKSPSSPKMPVLKLQTKFDARSKDEETQDDSSAISTAKPSDWLPIMLQPFHSSSIDGILSAGVMSPGPSPARLGPRTPNGYEDISPVTRGEWGFLMIDDAFQGRKNKATVGTCWSPASFSRI